jgi:predicted SAM-dependent methyltransferase
MTQKLKHNNYYDLRDIWRKLLNIRMELKLYKRHVLNNKYRLKKLLANKNKLHFGSGLDIKEGFINIDLHHLADIFLDIRAKLNIPDNSIKYIYSSHLVEHLEHAELVTHLSECYRILEPGGVLRIGFPDFPKVFRFYCADDKEFLELWRKFLSEKFGLPSDKICAMDYINRSVYEFGQHKTCLDMEKMNNLLTYAGFSPLAINALDFDPQIDVNARREYTLFVEAVK